MAGELPGPFVDAAEKLETREKKAKSFGQTIGHIHGIAETLTSLRGQLEDAMNDLHARSAVANSDLMLATIKVDHAFELMEEAEGELRCAYRLLDE